MNLTIFIDDMGCQRIMLLPVTLFLVFVGFFVILSLLVKLRKHLGFLLNKLGLIPKMDESNFDLEARREFQKLENERQKERWRQEQKLRSFKRY